MILVIKISSFLIVLAGISWGAKILTPKTASPKMMINSQVISVEVAETPEKIVQGLSGREKLAENQGMLFIFEQAGNYTFWMKDMRFALDFLFINGNRVVDLAENVPPPGPNQEPQTVIARSPFDQVLEINAGQISKLNIKIGNQISLK